MNGNDEDLHFRYTCLFDAWLLTGSRLVFAPLDFASISVLVDLCIWCNAQLSLCLRAAKTRHRLGHPWISRILGVCRMVSGRWSGGIFDNRAFRVRVSREPDIIGRCTTYIAIYAIHLAWHIDLCLGYFKENDLNRATNLDRLGILLWYVSTVQVNTYPNSQFQSRP